MREEYKYYVIYSLTPLSDKRDVYRLVEAFDNEEDAKSVLAALEKVNISFDCYKLIEEDLSDIKWKKTVKRHD